MYGYQKRLFSQFVLGVASQCRFLCTKFTMPCSFYLDPLYKNCCLFEILLVCMIHNSFRTFVMVRNCFVNAAISTVVQVVDIHEVEFP